MELYLAEAWNNENYERQIVMREQSEDNSNDDDSLDFIILNILRQAGDFLQIYHENPGKEDDSQVQLVKRVFDLIEQWKKNIQKETKCDSARHSFDVEYKVREHVKAILNQLIEVMGENEYRIESERVITIFDQADKNQRKDEQHSCRPDFEIMLKNDNQSMLIVEVKSRFTALHYPDKKINAKKIEKEQIRQHLKQLRSNCILEAKNYMVGVLTNSQEWLFCRYNMCAEIAQSRLRKQLEEAELNQTEIEMQLKAFKP